MSTIKHESNAVNTFVFPIIRQDFIINALKTLREFTPPNYKTIVVNQTQTNPLFERVLRDTADIVITANVNWGFAQASNLGASMVRSDYVTVANDDLVFWNREWWQGVLDTFERFPNALGVNPSSPKEPGWGYNEPVPRIYATLEDCQKYPDAIANRLKTERKGAMVDGIAMWCTVFRRKEWEELGMFDERFTPGGSEDYDLLGRAYQADYRVLGTSFSWVYHHWGRSKDDPTGFDVALPKARPDWNKTSTEQFGDEGLWHPKLDVWGKNCERTDPNVERMPL